MFCLGRGREETPVERTKRTQSFLEGALVLSAATAVVKVLGALFKIPLVNLLGGVGMGCFMSAYDLFTPVYSLTVTGLSVAVSRSVAHAAARGRRIRPISCFFCPEGCFFSWVLWEQASCWHWPRLLYRRCRIPGLFPLFGPSFRRSCSAAFPLPTGDTTRGCRIWYQLLCLRYVRR